MKKQNEKSNEQIYGLPQPAVAGTNLLAIAPKGAGVKRTGGNGVLVAVERSVDEILADICTPTGVHRDEVAMRIIDQVGKSLVRPRPGDTDALLIQAVSMIEEMAPKNLTEALLATQMIAANEAALLFLNRATLESQHSDGIDRNLNRATRLMRVFTEQLEAMQKLKGKASQQKVTVEHVHVHGGGQAIVGAVAAPTIKGGGGTDGGN
jgi:hypothetical protein